MFSGGNLVQHFGLNRVEEKKRLLKPIKQFKQQIQSSKLQLDLKLLQKNDKETEEKGVDQKLRQGRGQARARESILPTHP